MTAPQHLDASPGEELLLGGQEAISDTPTDTGETPGRWQNPPQARGFRHVGEVDMPPEIRNSAAVARLLPALEARFTVKGDAGEIEGLAAGFGDNLPDAYGDTIAPGAFARTLAAHRAAGTMPAMLWAHDPAEPIGVWLDMTETARGLEVRGRLNLEVRRAQEAYALLKQGALRGLSIGFAEEKSEARGDGGRRITQADLWEVSLVTFPARKEARVAEVRSARDLEKLLRDAGLPRAAATKAASGGWPALAPNRNLADLAQMMTATAAKLKG